MALTPDKVQALAHQASTYACQALLSNEHWQEVRDQKFAELVTRDALEEAAKVCDRGAEQMMHAYKREGAGRCAAAIRKLKEGIQ